MISLHKSILHWRFNAIYLHTQFQPLNFLNQINVSQEIRNPENLLKNLKSHTKYIHDIPSLRPISVKRSDSPFVSEEAAAGVWLQLRWASDTSHQELTAPANLHLGGISSRMWWPPCQRQTAKVKSAKEWGFPKLSSGQLQFFQKIVTVTPWGNVKEGRIASAWSPH